MMKNSSSSSSTPFALALAWLASFFLCFNLAAQTSPEDAHGPDVLHHEDPTHKCLLDLEDVHRFDAQTIPASLKFEAPTENGARSANVELSFQPSDNPAEIYYEQVAGWTNGAAIKAQVSIRNYVKNLGANALNLRKITYSYVQAGVAKSKHFYFDTANIVINPGQTAVWQNGREYHEVGNVLYLNSPIPTSITISFWFVGESVPVSITKNLVPYSAVFGLPFRAFDLDYNEVWQGGSTHGGGSQVFAYDLSVQGLENGVWDYHQPGTNGTQNAHHRVWGKPIYAMADGTVESFDNNVPNNPWPDSIQVGGGGNYFKITHGTHIALYAHMIMGSLNPALMQIGAVVKKGDFLGLAGNSGSSSGPHLHIHIAKITPDGQSTYIQARPLLFNEGWVIQKSSFTSLSNTAPWNKLTTLGLPGYAGSRPFIWPSKTKPFYTDYVYTGVFRESTDGHTFLTGLSSTLLSTKDTELKAQGLRMTDLHVIRIGTTYKYSAIWRPGTGASTVQKGTTLSTFVSQWNTLSGQGQRLLDIEVYKDANGNLRFAGVYGAGTWGHYLYIGKTQSEFNTIWNNLAQDGYQLVDIEVYNFGGQTLYAGIWKLGSSGNQALWHASNWTSFTNQWATLSGQGYRLVDLDTDNTGANTIYSGTFLPATGGYALYESNWNAFVSMWEHLSERDMAMIDFGIRPATGSTLEGGADDRDADLASADVEEILLMGPENSPFDLKQEEKQQADFEMSVFPNPVGDYFTLRAETEILDWSLTNALGQTLRRGDQTGETRHFIEVSDLKPGIYSLRVRTAQGIRTQQIEKI